jgi:hypothetical protein
MDTISPKMPLCFWSDAGDMDKGMLEQIVFPFSLSNTAQAIKVKQRYAMTWIDVSYIER